MKNEPIKNPTDSVSTAPQKRAVYSKEFKLDAVRRLKEGSQSATALALELGIRRTLLYKWAQELEQHGPTASFKKRGRKPADQESENARLRRQVADLQMENEILKKFDAYLRRLKL
jgi:transposase